MTASTSVWSGRTVDAVTDPDGGSLAYEYFASLLARETLAGDVDGSVSWTYDSRHRLRTESVNDAQLITIEYDEDGTPERSAPSRSRRIRSTVSSLPPPSAASPLRTTTTTSASRC
jgi:hypothetical protein